MHSEQLSTGRDSYGCGCGKVRRDIEFGEKEMNRHVRLLWASEDMNRCTVTYVPDVVSSVCVTRRRVAVGMGMGVAETVRVCLRQCGCAWDSLRRDVGLERKR